MGTAGAGGRQAATTLYILEFDSTGFGRVRFQGKGASTQGDTAEPSGHSDRHLHSDWPGLQACTARPPLLLSPHAQAHQLCPERASGHIHPVAQVPVGACQLLGMHLGQAPGHDISPSGHDSHL